MKQHILILTLGLLPSFLFGQRLAAFEDDQRFFFVYDEGVVTRLETLPVASFHVGGKYVAYINTNSMLHIYHKGEVFKPDQGIPDRIIPTDHLMVFRFGSQIQILEGLRFETVESWAVGPMVAGDSMIAFHNNVNSFKCWYNDSLYQLEEWEVQQFECSDNLLAYVDRFGYLKVFYRGEVIQIEDFPPMYMVPGREMLAYVDNLGNFKIFDHGEVYELTAYPLMEKHIYMPDGMVVFKDDINRTMLFKDGEVSELFDQEPRQIWANENMITFLDQSERIYTYYNDELIYVDRLTPVMVDMDNDIMVYTDFDMRLRGLVFGEKRIISEDIPKAWKIYNQVVAFTALKGMIKFYDNGETVTFSF